MKLPKKFIEVKADGNYYCLVINNGVLEIWQQREDLFGNKSLDLIMTNLQLNGLIKNLVRRVIYYEGKNKFEKAGM